MYKGSFLAGLSFLIFTTIGYLLFIVPGFCFHIWAILDAYNTMPAQYVLKEGTARDYSPKEDKAREYYGR
jgi:hypothetical protein